MICKLKNLKPVRVMVRLQSSAIVRVATAHDLAALGEVLMIQASAGGEWIASSSDPRAQYGTVLAVME